MDKDKELLVIWMTMVKKILFLNLVVVANLTCMDDSNSAFIMFPLPNTPLNTPPNTPKQTNSELSNEGLELLEGLENALLYKDKKIQEKYIEDLTTFMEGSIGRLTGDLKANFEKKFFKIYRIKPCQNSIPLDFEGVEIKSGVFIDRYDICFKQIERNFSSSKNNKIKSAKNSSESSPSSSFESTSHDDAPRNLKRTTSAIGKINEMFKKSNEKPPASNFNIKSTQDSSESPPLSSFLKELSSNQDKQICKVIINPIFIQWLEAYQEHIKNTREKLDFLAKNNFYLSLSKEEEEINKRESRAIQKFLEIQTEEELKEAEREK